MRSPEVMRLRRELAEAIAEAVGPGGQHVVAPAYGIPQARMSELERGNVERCTIDWLVTRVYAMGGHVTLTVELPDVRRAFWRSRFERRS